MCQEVTDHSAGVQGTWGHRDLAVRRLQDPPEATIHNRCICRRGQDVPQNNIKQKKEVALDCFVNYS